MMNCEPVNLPFDELRVKAVTLCGSPKDPDTEIEFSDGRKVEFGAGSISVSSEVKATVTVEGLDDVNFRIAITGRDIGVNVAMSDAQWLGDYGIVQLATECDSWRRDHTRHWDVRISGWHVEVVPVLSAISGSRLARE